VVKVFKVLKVVLVPKAELQVKQVQSVPKGHRVRLELKGQFKVMLVLKELRELKVQQELKVRLLDMEVL
jgi:hypothetical protein